MRFIRLGAREKICPGPGLALGGPGSGMGRGLYLAEKEKGGGTLYERAGHAYIVICTSTRR